MSIISSIESYSRIVIWELIYSGYYIALIAPIIVILISILLNLPINPYILLIAYLPPLIVYSYNYYSEIRDDTRSNPERVDLLKKKSHYYPFIIAAYIITLILLLALSGNIAVIIFLLSLNFLGILYTLFLKGVTNKIPLFKNIFVSFIWASGAIFLPLLYYSKTISLPFILAYLFIWIEAFLNTIFFDIKDEESDRLRGLKTMPAILGNKRTLQFLYIANVLAFIPLLLGVYLNILPLFTLSILALLIYKSYYLHIGGAADDKGLRTITYTLIDTEFIIMLVLLIIGSLIMNIL